MLRLILTIIIFLISIKFVFKVYDRCKETYERIIFILMFVVFLSPVVIFYLDYYNIPSLFGYAEKINTKDWLSFIMNYLGTIISSIIGAVFLVYMTTRQIVKNSEENQESHRIQNMPLLNYAVNTSTQNREEKDNIETIFTKNDGKIYCLNIEIKNIGLNCVKDIIIKINSDIIKQTQYLISDEMQNILIKDKTLEIGKNLYLKMNNNYKFILNIQYEDVLNNWYSQEAIIDYKAKDFGVAAITVKGEKLLKNTEKIVEEMF